MQYPSRLRWLVRVVDCERQKIYLNGPCLIDEVKGTVIFWSKSLRRIFFFYENNV